MSKTELAFELRDEAERLVRMAEAAVAGARGYTERDVAETELQECLALQDECLEAIAPTIEERERQVVAGVHAAVAALRGDPMSDWTQRHRRWHSAAVKARLSGALGVKTYMRAWPW